MEPKFLFWLLRFIGHKPDPQPMPGARLRNRPVWTAHGYVEAPSLPEAWQQVREGIRDGRYPAPAVSSYYMLLDATHVRDLDADDLDDRYEPHRRVKTAHLLPRHTHEVTLRVTVVDGNDHPEKLDWPRLLPKTYSAEHVNTREVA